MPPTGAEALARIAASMTATLRHRGPDDEGYWVDDRRGIALGHTRLAIIDLSRRAKQPMVGPSGATHIVFNGEIYNHVELRKELRSQGVRFHNDSDTLVIQALYERDGLECLKRLRGMFGLAIWDARQQQLVLARDRVGKKPLYYCRQGGALYFASEIKAIVRVLGDPPSVDPAAISEYLGFGFIGQERTIYSQIMRLPPGSALVATSPDQMRISPYWKPQWESKRGLSRAEAVERADRLITEAVRLRLRSDVPVGVFLSGGIDSGLVTAAAARSMGSRLQTFSVGFAGDSVFDERDLARQVARRYDTDHHEVVLKPDVAELVPKIAWHHDEPFGDASAIPSFAVAEFAARHVKVVLNGDGGDELFAGYRRHLAASAMDLLSRFLPQSLMRPAAAGALRILPSSGSFRTRYALFRRFLRGLAALPSERLLSWHADGFTDAEKSSLLRGGQVELPRQTSVADLAQTLSTRSELGRTLAMELVWSLPGDLLVKMDIATMAHGLEARSPLLDQELVAWANTLPDSIRLGGFTTKPILRALAARYLPKDVVQAPKRGFEIPLRQWLEEDLREMRDDLILARDGVVCSLFERSALEDLLRRPPDNPVRWARLSWLLLMLAAWDRYSRSTAAWRSFPQACNTRSCA